MAETWALPTRSIVTPGTAMSNGPSSFGWIVFVGT
jgi:hypothetical protein